MSVTAGLKTAGRKPPAVWPVDAVLVDLDGTLVDTLGDFVEALNRMLAELPWSSLALDARPAQPPRLSAPVVERMVGKGSEHLIDSALQHALSMGLGSQGDTGEQAEHLQHPQRVQQAAKALYPQAWGLYQQHYLAINGQHSAVYPGAFEALQTWRSAGLPMVCLTNKPLAFAQQLLSVKGLDGFFAEVFGGDSFARKKPDPLPLLSSCQALGVAPAHCLMVGDSVNDALAARAAHCPVALVSYGYNHGLPIKSVDADAHVDALTELVLARRS